MPPGRRKIDNFDPNKSDSADDDFDPTEVKASAKKSRKSTKTPSRSKRPSKRGRYKGSDISEGEELSDSLLEQSFSESVESEEVEMNEATGRPVRRATKKAQTYEESSEEDVEPVIGDIDSDDSDVHITKGKNKRTRAAITEEPESEDTRPTKKQSKVIKLKINPQSVRAGSQGRTLRGRKASVEPRSAGLPPATRRNTRAHTEEGDVIALSDSGKHIIRDGHSPEPITNHRSAQGSKGLKQPASTIKEEINESSSHDHEAESSAKPIEIAGSDDDAEVTMENEHLEGDAEDYEDELAKPGENTEPAPPADEADDEDDDIPISRSRRARGSRAGLPVEEEEEAQDEPVETGRLRTRASKGKRKSTADVGSDFEPGEDKDSDEEMSDDAGKKQDEESESSPVRGGRRARQVKSKSSSRRRGSHASDLEEPIDQDELDEEVYELHKNGSRKRRVREDTEIAYDRPGRKRKKVDYSIKPMDQIYAQDEDAEDAAPTPTRRAKGGRNGASQAWDHIHSTFGPFGGGGGPAPAIAGPWGTGAAGGADSDSSDDEIMHRPTGVGGNVGMTPTSAFPPGLLPGFGQTNNPEAMAGLSGTPANLGKIKSKKELADADPLGVDQDVDFTKIGGLEGHIDQLKEMVQMPLLYPELFLKFKVTPPRGVLFHGPPGTGKTLLARALAAQSSSGGRKITFYMRKGADALSKWVGEAERQLRLLFEEARKTQPSIIFFDEIDGLAPVRSSKQEQIHASIVSTLLALMDGMDGRGQVIVIGATNRPDNIDPALRRPGRFDREFYFPLPDVEGRKSILNIHTKDWGLDDSFKNSLAQVTKGYGGADLRALCTEAALNAMQRTYPQIYSSNDKLKVDPDKIKITAKDFMLSVKKMIPSSERSTSSGAAPLPKMVVPLLKDQLKLIEQVLDGLIPIKKKTTALQEAMYEQYDDEDHGFGRETLQQDFEKSRVFRPRLLICGEPGMGQSYLGGAILDHFEGLHVQSFDLPTIFSDSARSPEAAIVQIFAEVKRHKPSVIYLPGIETWYHTLSEFAITTFLGLLRSIPPTDPVLVLGITDTPHDKLDQNMLRDLFGYSRKNRFTINRPTAPNRREFFSTVVEYIKKAPKDFPEPTNRKKRKLEVLELVPPPPPKPPTKEEIKAQKKRDHQLLNILKIAIQPIMDQIQKKYRKFRAAVLNPLDFKYLLDELDPDFVRPDIAAFRPFEWDTDKGGVRGLRETTSGKFYYNLDTTTIEERLSNGFYARPKDFLADIRSLAKDAKHSGDKERTLKANELLSNVEVDIGSLEVDPRFADCENLYQRQLQRAKEREEKLKKRQVEDVAFDDIVRSDIDPNGLGSQQHSSGPLTLGEPIPGRRVPALGLISHTPSGLSNGFSADDVRRHGSNGTSNPSHVGEDTQMRGTDEHSSSQGMQPPRQPSMASGPSATKPNTQMSQRSFFQEISHDTPVKDLQNDASTTTSGKKTSDGWSTQATNGVTNQNSSSPGEHVGDSQLPNTQGNTQGDTSSEEWAHSQAHALARGQILTNFNSQTPSTNSQRSQPPAVSPFSAGPRMPVSKSRTSVANILNDSPVEPTSSQASSQKDCIVDEFFVVELHNRLVEGSSGCSIEQLEQVNRELMESLWEQRGEYNRNQVMTNLAKVFNETISDIEEMQKVLRASQLTPGNSQNSVALH